MPTNTKQVRQFVGMAQYYRRFVEKFARMAKPLTDLLKKDDRFLWTKDCQQAFETLRKALTSSPILVFPDFTKHFTLYTDASGVALGAVLTQMQDRKEHVVEYFSRVLSKPERNYSTIEREALAIVTAVKHFRPYLYGRRFTVLTDHQPLKWALNNYHTSNRLTKFGLALQDYDIEIRYHPGKKNGPADALSRLEVAACELKAQPSPIEYRRKQEEDLLIKGIIHTLEAKTLPTKLTDVDLSYIRRHKDDFTLRNQCLYRKARTRHRRLQLVIPSRDRKKILTEAHDGLLGAHLGEKKTLAKITINYFWPSIDADVEDWVKRCQPCAARKAPPSKVKAPLQNIPVEGPFHRVGMDILGPLPRTSSGKRYIIVFMDYFTKYPECRAIRDQSATTVAKAFVEEVVLRHGAPTSILSDQGRNFVSDVMKEVCELLTIQKTTTSPYHPACNGLTERFNKTLIDMLSMFCETRQKDWDIYIPYVLMAYRASVHASTGESPFFLLHGRDPVLPTQLLYPVDQEQTYTDASSYKYGLLERFKTAWDIVQTNIKSAQDKQKEHYDRTVNDLKFNVGDVVRVYTPRRTKGLSPKLQSRWFGPYRIENVTDTNVKIRFIDLPRGPLKTVHKNRIKPARLPHAHGKSEELPSDDNMDGVTDEDITDPQEK